MKKVLKLSSLLAAVLLLAALAGVQLLTAQSSTTTLTAGQSYVSNDKAAGDGEFTVRLVNPAPAGGANVNGANATTTVTVTNSRTDVAYKLVAGVTTTVAAAAQATYELDITVLATTTIDVDQTGTAVKAEDATTPDRIELGVGQGKVHGLDGDEIVISFRPSNSLLSRTATVTVDTKGPSVTNLSPVHNTRTTGGTIRFSADISDSGSGIGSTAASVIANTTVTIAAEEITEFKATKPASGASTVSVVLTLGEGAFAWDVAVKDALGNVGNSDAVPDDKDDTTTADAGNQDHSVVVDISKPLISSARTGSVLDTSEEKAVEKKSGSRTGIAVTFLDGGGASVEKDGGLDGTTIDDTDFRVDIDGQSQDIASVTFNSDLPKTVFITLANDLAGDDKPVVRLVGPVSDLAGNSAGTGQKTASDGIAPILTVAVDGSSGNATNGTLTVLVSADEKSRNPSRTSGITVIPVVEPADGENKGKQVVGDPKTGVSAASFRTVTSGEQWEWTFKSGSGLKDGKYNIHVSVNDISGDTGNAGTKGTASGLIDADKSVVFEVDTSVGAPAITPTKTDNTIAFIEIDMAAEAGEYTGDSHSKITTLTATVGGESVSVNTIDSKKFTIAPPAGGYEIGKHDVIVTATDEVGNTKTFSKVTVEITPRAAFVLNLRPGYNLVSLPGMPESTAINDVIPADHDINQVLSYTPDGGWMSAERGDDGMFAGTLETLDGSTAYVVRTTSFAPLNVMIPRTAAGDVLPPQTNLSVGWNLVPVIDLSSDLASGATIADYFLGIGDAILTIDDSGRLVANTGDDGTVGKGYWVYASRPAVLLPTRR